MSHKVLSGHGSQGEQPKKEKPVFRSEDLFQGKKEVVILHGEFQYRLQLTKAGKLILNK